jgi:hypothetical protein
MKEIHIAKGKLVTPDGATIFLSPKDQQVDFTSQLSEILKLAGDSQINIQLNRSIKKSPELVLPQTSLVDCVSRCDRRTCAGFVYDIHKSNCGLYYQQTKDVRLIEQQGGIAAVRRNN